MSIGGGQGRDQTTELWGLMGGEEADSPPFTQHKRHRDYFLLLT